MVIKNICILVFKRKMASILEGLTLDALIGGDHSLAYISQSHFLCLDLLTPSMEDLTVFFLDVMIFLFN